MFRNTNKGRRTGESLLELLLAACLMTVALVPLFQVYRLSRPPERKSEMEFSATLLARHVLERIIALRRADPAYLPGMTSEEPVVAPADGFQPVSEHFKGLFGHENGIEKSDNSILYDALEPFKCRIDTYYLDGGYYKVIVYIQYEESGYPKRVFLERLLPGPTAAPPGDNQ
ncbi:MAG TPA: hypothetical protein PKM25_10875 [Candidatus Ozemobacteraceae bacterium]|nr:hypothetical protein [Candidatus Ozemobacteraceae bacterium]